MKNHCKQKELTSISLKFKTPQCVNLYRKVICPDQLVSYLKPNFADLKDKNSEREFVFQKNRTRGR